MSTVARIVKSLTDLEISEKEKQILLDCYDELIKYQNNKLSKPTEEEKLMCYSDYAKAIMMYRDRNKCDIAESVKMFKRYVDVG